MSQLRDIMCILLILILGLLLWLWLLDDGFDFYFCYELELELIFVTAVPVPVLVLVTGRDLRFYCCWSIWFILLLLFLVNGTTFLFDTCACCAIILADVDGNIDATATIGYFLTGFLDIGFMFWLLLVLVLLVLVLLVLALVLVLLLLLVFVLLLLLLLFEGDEVDGNCAL